jgi:hypothetical protein
VTVLCDLVPLLPVCLVSKCLNQRRISGHFEALIRTEICSTNAQYLVTFYLQPGSTLLHWS